MSTPIYQIFIGKNNVSANLAWNSIPKAERDELLQKERSSREAVQARPVVMCNSAWADEEHPWWGCMRFPSLEARIQHTKTLAEIGWLDRVDAFSLLGTSENEPAEVTFPNPIYKLWLIRGNPSAAQAQSHLEAGLEAAMWEKHNTIYAETGSVTVISCDSYWCNEAYPYFGISAYPNIEANMKVMETLRDLGWQAMLDCFTVLGTPSQNS